MGIYLNPGYENFKETLSAPIYVDKTMMIAQINQMMNAGNKYICISRPRRFGKTIASNMLCAYYSRGCDAKELFAPYQIASDPCFEEKLNKYHVIMVDMNSEYQNTKNKESLISRLTEKIKKEMCKAFPEAEIDEDDTLADSILKVYSDTGETFIILMDEYDVLVREQVSQALFDEYLSFLNGLFKSNTLRPAISLAYLTGILPVVRDKIQSKLNNFREYTILDALNLTEFIGFTDEDVRKLCVEYPIDYKECRLWYDGYTQNGYEIYNPESVVQTIETGNFENHWGKTSSYRVISDLISRNFSGTRDAVIRMLAGEQIDVNVTRFLNTMDSFVTKDDVFTYLIHVGYLAYDAPAKTCRIPNKEVRQEWLNAIEADDDYEVTNRIIHASRELLTETFAGNADAVAKALDVSHIHVSSNRSYNHEDVLQSAIYLAYLYALNRYTVVREMPTGKGFAVVVYIPVWPEDPAMVIELKRNDCVESALDQIRERKYFDSLSHYSGNLYLVGINYDEKEKTHTCVIEQIEKA